MHGLCGANFSTAFLESDRVKTAVKWVEPETEEFKLGVRIIINHFKSINQVAWHGLGDYLATVMPDGANRSVVIHQLSRRMSQFPFSKSKGLVQCVLFHPIKPQLFVAVSILNENIPNTLLNLTIYCRHNEIFVFMIW